MAAVTQQIHNYLSGVSKQPDSKKLPGQVRECLNGFPDVTLGLTKRPGFKFLASLKNTSGTAFTGTTLDGAKWFYINRGDGVRYIGCITPKVGGTNGSIYAWNADTGAAKTVLFDAKAWAASTSYALNDKVTNDTGKVYKCTTAGTSASSGGPTGTSTNITDGSAKWDYQHASSQSYLTGVNSNYNVLTVHDTTIITNNTVEVEVRTAPTFTAATRGTVMLRGTDTQMASETFTVTVAGQTATYTSGSSDGYDEVLDGLKSAIVALNVSGITSNDVTKFGTTLQIDRVVSGTRTAFTLEAKGGLNNQGIEIFQSWVDNPAQLPPQSLHGHVVEIKNTAEFGESAYYAQFIADDGVSGKGFWEETVGPEAVPGFKLETMPHRLMYYSDDDHFILEQGPYLDRLVGDGVDTNVDPSFVGKKIEQAFFHGKRLGFLSTDNVALSKAEDPYNFFLKSARTVGSGDRIDVSVASIRPVVIHAVRPTAQGLVLFSKSQQFLLYSEQGPLAPATTKIRTLSNMEMDDTVDPVDVGTHMNFISKTPNYTRVFALQTRGLQESPLVLDIGRIVNEWITIDVDNFIASVQNDFIAMSSQTSNTVYFYKTYSDGEELLMESWFKWQLPGLVKALEIDQDDMYSVTKQGSEYTLLKANLTQSPETAIIVNNQGQKVNPCMDLYSQLPASDVTYRNVKSIAVTAGGSGYSSAPTVVISAPPVDSNNASLGVQATATATVSGGAVTAITVTNGGSHYILGATVSFTGGGGSGATATATVDSYDGSKCYLPYNDESSLTPVIVIAGSTVAGTFADSGFTITPERADDSDGKGPYFKVPYKDLSQSTDIVVGYKYDYDIELPKLHYKLNEDGSAVDYTASLTIARCKFDVGLSGMMGFKLNTVGRLTGSKTHTYTQERDDANPKDLDFNWNVADLDYVDRDQVKVKVNNVVTTAFTFKSDTEITLTNAPTVGATVLIYTDDWYNIQPTTTANTYLADDVPLDESNVFTVPIHQRSKNFSLRLFNDSPFPVSLNSMMWEGNYSPRFYRRRA